MGAGDLTRGQRLRTARVAAGLTAAVVAERSGYSVSGIRALENGQNDLRAEAAERLAPIVKTTAAYLLTGEASTAARQLVPLVGYVGAGDAAHFYDTAQGPFEMVEAPENATAKTVAAEVRGQSIGRNFDGWLVFYDQVQRPVTPELHGRLCVVALPDGRVLVKWLRPSRDARYFHLDSETEPAMNDVEVEWAARVTSMRPR